MEQPMGDRGRPAGELEITRSGPVTGAEAYDLRSVWPKGARRVALQ